MDEQNPELHDDIESEEEYSIKNSVFIVLSIIIGLILALWFTL